jgi:hypothetical protein
MADFKITDRDLKEALDDLASQRARGDEAQAKAAEEKVGSEAEKVANTNKQSAGTFLKRLNIGFAVAGAALIVFSVAYSRIWDSDAAESRRTIALAIPIAVLLVAALAGLAWSRGGIFAYVRGKDERLSTSLTQIALWTIALATAFLYFIMLDALSAEDTHSLSTTLGTSWNDFPEEYLLLLGGPFAAAVIARMSVGTKVEDGRLQKIEANQTKLRDVVTNDDGSASLVDSQFLVFNLVALVYFTIALIQDQSGLPPIPPVLAGLTSVAALGYTAAKTAEANQPVIASVTRRLGAAVGGARAGELVEIRGMNFVPPGAASQEFVSGLAVRFGTTDVLPEVERDSQQNVTSPTDTSIIARVPETLPAGTVDVTVITASGAQTLPYTLSILADKAIVTGLDPVIPEKKKALTVKGRFFRSPRATTQDEPTVMFDAIAVPPAPGSTDNQLSVAEVPDTLPGPDAKLKVIAAGAIEPSDEVTITLKP